MKARCSTLLSLGITTTLAAGIAWAAGAKPSASPTGWAPSSDDHPLWPDVSVLEPDAVESIIADRAGDLPMVIHTRQFRAGQAQARSTAAPLHERLVVTFDPRLDVIRVYGRHAVEDVRLVEHEGRLHILWDFYEDAVNTTAGRSLPIPLTEGGVDTKLTTKATSSPTILSVSGVNNDASGVRNGRIAIKATGGCGTTYDGAFAVNDKTGIFPMTLNGSNFGTSTGSVQVAGRTAKIVSWNAGKVVVDPTVPYNWGPMSAVITVKSAAGASTTYAMGIAPAIRSRVYGQCTHEVARTRLAMGKQPSDTAYGSYTSFTPKYVPQAGDQLQWSGKHTAIITAVSKSTSSGGYTTWTLTVREANATCKNTINVYTTTFQVRSTGSSSTITALPKSSASNLGNATSYYK